MLESDGKNIFNESVESAVKKISVINLGGEAAVENI
jgi:hypothetical protein